jgi:hypothetical protein
MENGGENYIYKFFDELRLFRSGFNGFMTEKLGGLYYMTNEHHHAPLTAQQPLEFNQTIWRVHSPKPRFQSATKVRTIYYDMSIRDR